MNNEIAPKNLLKRREFLEFCLKALPTGLLFAVAGSVEGSAELKKDAPAVGANGKDKKPLREFGMAIDIRKCIGCGRCADACKTENNVPRTPPVCFRTWVERYTVMAEGEPKVDSPNGGIDGFPDIPESSTAIKSFFVPKICNHCAKPPCVQVCPVGATFRSPEGVVLVDQTYCVGCRYCIQACPYGARYFHPEKSVADKCTFCFHRIKKGLFPACVEVCPTQARVFGELGSHSSLIWRFIRANATTVLKPELNTKPNVFYAGAPGEVR